MSKSGKLRNPGAPPPVTNLPVKQVATSLPGIPGLLLEAAAVLPKGCRFSVAVSGIFVCVHAFTCAPAHENNMGNQVRVLHYLYQGLLPPHSF